MPRLIYTLERTFPSLEEAVQFVSASYSHLKKKGTKRTSSGRRTAFVCRSFNCSCRAEVCEQEDVVEFRKHGEHNPAAQLPERDTPFNEAVREVIEPLVGDVRPTVMNRALRRRGLPELKPTQLSQFAARYRRRIHGITRSTMSFDELHSWCQAKVKNDDNEHHPYVKIFNVDSATAKSVFLLTTPKLEQVSSRAATIAVDATYRVNWNGIPMFIAGIVDAAGSFRLTHAGLMSSEDEENFAFLLGGVLCEATTAVIADNAPAITNALEGFEVKRINCWAHMIRAVDGKLRALPHREERSAIRSA